MNYPQSRNQITPNKGINPKPTSKIQEVNQDIQSLRRKSCECSECGKSNRTIQRLYLQDSQPLSIRRKSSEPKSSIEDQQPNDERKSGENQEFLGLGQKNKFQKTKCGFQRSQEKQPSMKSQRVLQYDLTTPRSLIKTQSSGYKRLTINLKKFGPSFYEFKEGGMIQSQFSNVGQDSSKSERQLAKVINYLDRQDSKQYSSSKKTSKIDKLFKIKINNKTLQTFVKQKQQSIQDKENFNPARKFSRADSIQMIDKQFYLSRKDNKNLQTQKTTLTDTLPSPKGVSNFSVYMVNDISPVMRERRSGSHHFFNRKQTIHRNQTKQL